MTRFLDLDLDAFLSGVAHWPQGGRLDDNEYSPWTETQLRSFLEDQCGLSALAPMPGWFVENHDGAFDVMKQVVVKTGQALEVVHVDGHADLGMGDPSWVYMISHVAASKSQRLDPDRGNTGLNLGSWLAFALAAELISDVTYAYPKGGGNDLPPLYFENGDTEKGEIELKAFLKPPVSQYASAPDYQELVRQKPDFSLPKVPFRKMRIEDYQTSQPFDFGLLCRSPDYTPPASDKLVPIVGEYISFEANAPQ